MLRGGVSFKLFLMCFSKLFDHLSGYKQACDRYVHSEPNEGFKFQFSDDKYCNE